MNGVHFSNSVGLTMNGVHFFSTHTSSMQAGSMSTVQKSFVSTVQKAVQKSCVSTVQKSFLLTMYDADFFICIAG